MLFGLDADDRFIGLARLAALFGFFHAVVSAVANHVQQRVGQRFDHGFVDLDFLANQLQTDLFALGQSQVAHHARETLEHELNRHHAQAHHAVLQARQSALYQCVGLLQAAQLVFQVFCHLLKIRQLGLGIFLLAFLPQAVQAFTGAVVTDDV